MPRNSRLLVLLLAALLPLAAVAAPSTAPRKTLKPFASEQELKALFDKWAEESRRRQEGRRSFGALAESPASAPQASVAKEAMSADSVTNVQHAGVDEGGIVKVHGDHLLILRRGRLFSVEISNLKPVSAVDAFGPGVDPRGAWYDEMLISGSTIAVIGYSYARGGTEIGLFEISRSGQLSYRATYHLRSNDYYSSRNYASRLIGSKLVFYTPLYLNPWRGNPYDQLPAMRRPGENEFRRIAPATRIYRSDEQLDPWQGMALHTVTVCDLAKPDLDCASTAVLGPTGRVFYVSPASVFVWNVKAAVFRIPLDGGAPSALKVAGSPIDQFSFLEGNDGFLNVLVRAHGRGEAMWSSEMRGGELALLRVHLSRFSDGRDSASSDNYQPLPGQAFQNRYVGQYLLYGAQRQLFAARYADGSTFGIPVNHAVDRLEALGEDAVAIGSDGRDLHFSSVRLAPYPAIAGRYIRANANQGETRSHGFFYNERQGLLGLPIIGGQQRTLRHQLRFTSASVLYLRNQSLNFAEIGTLDASADANTNDGCRASCVDWYGNSRPLFIRNRVFALMGYEIVEGQLGREGIAEVRRVNFSPFGGFRPGPA
ncbi:MAG TPA: beta-propeller domain-containing protein [Burkholderiales bacterium]|nr:beta-propeller domain-containing protein [Burkholderiales bacterium]